MRTSRFLIMTAALIVALGLVPVGAQALTDSQWIKGADGSWGEAAGWSTNPTIPNDGGYRAIIDNLVSNVTVTLDTDRVVGGLWVTLGDQLRFNGHQLHLNNNAVVDDAGTLFLSGGNSRLNANGSVATLQGSGMVYLGGNQDNHIQGTGFINALGHTIKGGGEINAPVANAGAVTADGGHTLTVFSTFTNSGTLGTEGNGVVQILGTVDNQPAGTIQPLGGLIRLQGAVLINPRFSSGNVLLSSDSIMRTSVNLAAGTVVTFDGQMLHLENNAVVSNTGTGGTFMLDGGNSRLNANGSVATLQGSGMVYMGGNEDNHIQGNGFINAAGHTIKGGGAIDAPVTNAGAVTADGGHTLTVFSTFTNSGTLGTEGNGVVQILGTVDNQPGGTIQPLGGLIRLQGALLINPVIGSGNVNLVSDSTMRISAKLDAGTTVTLNGHVLHLQNNAVVDNPGTFMLTGGNSRLNADGSIATLQGSGMVYMGGNQDNHIQGTGFVNTVGHTIMGGGEINAPVTNAGTVTADNTHTLSITNTFTNQGIVNTQGTGIVQIQSIFDNQGGTIQPLGGLIRLQGAVLINSVIGSGSVELISDSIMRTSAKLDAGTTVTLNSQVLHLENNAIVDNAGTFMLDGGNSRLNANGTVATLQGSGKVYLGGNQDNHLTGNGFVNAAGHTIIGGGEINAPVTNAGTVTADNTHTLSITNTFTNQGIVNTQGTGIVQIQNIFDNQGGTIQPLGGLIRLQGATLINPAFGSGKVELQSGDSIMRSSAKLDTGTTVTLNGHILHLENNAVVDNAGTFMLDGGNSRLNANGSVATLQGSGKVYMGGNQDNHLTGTGFVNAAGHTIIGGGDINTFVVNNGTMAADAGHTMNVFSAVSGNGNILIQDGTLNLHNFALQAGNLNMTQLAKFVVDDNIHVLLSKDFTFAQQNTAAWHWGANTALVMEGSGAPQFLEIGGEDFGCGPTGFSNNFDLVNLSLNGTGTFSVLQDAIDNGHRGGSGGTAEALYVDNLFVAAGDTLNLNGLHLYDYNGGHCLLVTATDDWFNGHGRIIDEPLPIPLPSTLLLLGSGLLGLGGLRRRLRKN